MRTPLPNSTGSSCNWESSKRRRIASVLTIVLLFTLSTVAARVQGRARKVPFLISDGTLVLDYTGAYEVFGQAKMKVFTVARTTDHVRLSSNMRVIPDYSIEKFSRPGHSSYTLAGAPV